MTIDGQWDNAGTRVGIFNDDRTHAGWQAANFGSHQQYSESSDFNRFATGLSEGHARRAGIYGQSNNVAVTSKFDSSDHRYHDTRWVNYDHPEFGCVTGCYPWIAPMSGIFYFSPNNRHSNYPENERTTNKGSQYR